MGKRYLPIKGPIYSFFGFWANVNGPKNREYRLVYTLENVNQWVQFGVGILFVQPMGLLLAMDQSTCIVANAIFRFFWILIQTIFPTYQQNQNKISHMTLSHDNKYMVFTKLTQYQGQSCRGQRGQLPPRSAKNFTYDFYMLIVRYTLPLLTEKTKQKTSTLDLKPDTKRLQLFIF